MQIQQVRHDLQTAFAEKNSLIELTKKVRSERGQYSVKKDYLLNLFERLPLWEKVPQKGGHAHFKHRLTRVSVGFQAHGSNTINPSIAIDVLDQVQEHLNILGNEIFQYSVRNWKVLPDYDQAARNFGDWNRVRRGG